LRMHENGHHLLTELDEVFERKSVSYFVSFMEKTDEFRSC